MNKFVDFSSSSRTDFHEGKVDLVYFPFKKAN